MIPQAMVSAGAYADLWSQLKSMQHALERVKNATRSNDVAELDKARLSALAEFLRNELEQKNAEDILSFSGFSSQIPSEHSYSLDVSVQGILQELPSFKEWLRSQKLAFKDKSLRLTTHLDDYVAKNSGTLFPGPFPQDEFSILSDLLRKLLRHTESALIA